MEVSNEEIEEVDATPKQDAWDMKDQHAYVILMSLLTTKVATQFGSKLTSKDLWEAIHARFEWSSDQRLIHLQMQFEELTFHEGESITEKLCKFIALRDKMAAIGNMLS